MATTSPVVPRFVRAARVAAALSLEAAALASGIGFVSLGRRANPFLENNELEPRTRTIAIAAALGAAAIAGLVAFALAFRDAWLTRVERGARMAALGVPLGMIPTLLASRVWVHRPLEFLILLSLVVLIIERTARISFEAWCESRWFRARSARLRMSTRTGLVVALVSGAIFAVATGYLSVLRHHRLGTGAYDLAIFDNMMFNGLHGHPFRSTVMFGDRPGNAIADHAHYAELLFLPIYALWPRAETLLVIQAAVLGLAAVPLYLFAVQLLAPGAALVVALAYLFYAPLHGAEFYDFHWLTLAVFFHFSLFYALAARRLAIGVASVLVLYALREDIAPGVAIVGLFLISVGERVAAGAVLAVVSILWTVTNKFVLMPLAGPWWFVRMYDSLVPPGEKDWSGVARTLLSNPTYVATTLLQEPKLEYVLHLLAPLAFLPLRRLAFWTLLIPGVLFTVLTNWSPAFSIRFQYTAHWIAYLFAAVVLALHVLQSTDVRRFPPAVLALSVGVLVHSFVFGVVFVPDSFVADPVKPSWVMTAAERARYGELRRIIALVPDDASVTSTDIEAPHLSNRLDVYAAAQDDTRGQFVLVNTESLGIARTRQNLARVLSDPDYGLVAAGYDGRFLLFRRGQRSAGTREAKARIGIFTPNAPT